MISQWGLRGPQPTTEESNEAFVDEIFAAIEKNHPSVWESGQRTAEEEAALAREQKARREARMKQLYPNRRH
jgi:hypothetical protein